MAAGALRGPGGSIQLPLARPRPRTPALLVALLAAASVAGCSGEGSGETAAAGPPRLYDPARDGDFHRPPPELVPEEPGRLVWVQRLTTPPVIDAWRILYTSTALGGETVPVSGYVAAPGGRPRGNRPLVSFATGTVGLGDGCTLAGAENGPLAVLGALAEVATLQGWVGVLSDLPGLDTPGPHPYLVGEPNARALLDAARAARRLGAAGARGEVAVAGFSASGQASIFAGQIAHRYAPELELAGVVAVAPPSQLERYLTLPPLSDLPGLFAMIAIGIGEAYGLDPARGLDPHDRRLLESVARACTGDQNGLPTVSELVPRFHDRAFVRRGPFERRPWRGLLRRQHPGSEPIESPVIIVQGGRDRLVPEALTRALVRRMCGLGGEVELDLIPGAGHTTEFDAEARERFWLPWLRDRFAGEPAPSSCGGGSR
jgi:alpha-beta hydrolase superfamily lysophospholipase